ncbi:hypothetical protein GCM10010211_61970 [Streptomyces albospinus]|uniref:Uncharacterized protein n=1 Tax=Streptomyces albospinus TaxID=285515 RepID=A0ABQ2VK62_9ACTN|nr:pyridoxamine 5'-phosphate oxidase family protein [Streptomyces albospinus]GGU87323.1 hypothetical protein GCM10010211_61970 [Streptomyces albospinus]
MIFTEREHEYLTAQQLARLATTGPDDCPQVRPVGFRLNDDGTIDIGGRWSPEGLTLWDK